MKNQCDTTDSWGIKEDSLFLYGAAGYLNGVEELNNICKLYTTEYGVARSIKQEDIDEITGMTEDNLKELDNDYEFGLHYGDEFGPYENIYTPESWLRGETETVEGTITVKSYEICTDADLLNNLRVEDMLLGSLGPYRIDNGPKEPGFWLATQAIAGRSRGKEWNRGRCICWLGDWVC